jgi:hypothetical protein
MSPEDVGQPLGQFQHTSLDREDIRKLLHTINSTVQESGERALPEQRLDAVFERFWPELEDKLKHIAQEKVEEKPKERTDSDVLKEILDGVRGQERRLSRIEEVLPMLARARALNTPTDLDSIKQRFARLLTESEAAIGSTRTPTPQKDDPKVPPEKAVEGVIDPKK